MSLALESVVSIKSIYVDIISITSKYVNVFEHKYAQSLFIAKAQMKYNNKKMNRVTCAKCEILSILIICQYFVFSFLEAYDVINIKHLLFSLFWKYSTSSTRATMFHCDWFYSFCIVIFALASNFKSKQCFFFAHFEIQKEIERKRTKKS